MQEHRIANRLSLVERLDSVTEAWRHEPDDRLIGEIVDVDQRDSGYGVYPTVTVVTEQGSTENGGQAIEPGDERVFHAFRTVPRNELAKRKPRIGDRIGIKYLGKPEGRDYEGYNLVLEQAERSELEWPAAEPPRADELQPSPAATDDDIPF
jgi:hypothetical protein